MALANTITKGQTLNHFGTHREVLDVKKVDGGFIELTIQEDGRTVTRTENGKTDLDVL